ncbi:hypothetical protein QE152_g34494 [Popillia japonica]|uniref:Uncharacterized protein n=1 Tax=Popillia japonica TaxID=7064 RepID=A0AAW1ITJ1_POPJA
MASAHAKPPEKNFCGNRTNIANSLKCKPRRVYVNILPDTNEFQPQIAGSVVQVKRCLGFDGVRRCVSAKSVNVSVKVNMVKNNKCRVFLVEQHVKCKEETIQPKVKPQLCDAGKRWNQEKSVCECHSKCTTGSTFSTELCSCLPHSQLKRTSSKT